MVEIQVVRHLDTSCVVGEAKGGIAFVTDPYTVHGNPINGRHWREFEGTAH